MTDMIEKVARAIALWHDGVDFDDCVNNRTEQLARGRYDAKKITQSDYLRTARIAISVMYEPTERMKNACRTVEGELGLDCDYPGDGETIYIRMINAALGRD